MNKKLIPYELLTTVEKILRENKDLIYNKKEDGCYYSIYDRDEQSGYYFQIVSEPDKFNTKITNPSEILCHAFPAGFSVIKKHGFTSELKAVAHTLRHWLEILKAYSNTESVYDDHFTKKYQDFYSNTFKIEDEDAEFAPFDPEQQDIIEAYLEHIEQRLLEYREEFTEDAAVIDEIIVETRVAINDLSVSTKKEVSNKIAFILAKIFKWKKSAAKELVTEASRQLVKKLIETGIKYLPAMIEKVKNLPEFMKPIDI